MLRRLGAIFLTFVFLLTAGAGCFGGGATTLQQSGEVTLRYWRVFDEEDTLEGIFDAYQAIHPNVSIEYRKLRAEDYENELLKALAKGEGPDIFAVHHSKIPEYQDYLQPMPATITTTYLTVKGTLRKETVMESREEPTMSLKNFKSQFIDAVVDDALVTYQPDPEDGREVEGVWGLPLGVDTLALFYNKDLLNAGGVAEPPATWDVFQEAVAKMTRIEPSTNKVLQSAAALGTAKNVERASDIVSVLMMQNGTQMTDEDGNVTFGDIPDGTPDGVFPALDAVKFYTDFANPLKEVYTWTDDFPNSFDAFARGQTAFFFGYSYHIPLLMAAAPKLHYAIAPLPQIAGGTQQANYANYWLEGVSKSTEHPDEAWSLILFATSAERVPSYLESAQKPTALRSLIGSQLESETLGVFASQLLTAKTWYRGKDAEAMEEAMERLITEVLTGRVEPEEAIDTAVQTINQTY